MYLTRKVKLAEGILRPTEDPSVKYWWDISDRYGWCLSFRLFPLHSIRMSSGFEVYIELIFFNIHFWYKK